MESEDKNLGRPCNVCRSFKREEIEEAIYASQPISQISRRFTVSTHSLYRHIRNHAAPALQEAFRASTQISTSSLVLRMSEIADSARDIRLNASTDDQKLKAGAVELKTLQTLFTRLGIEHEMMLQLVRDTEVLARVVGELSRRNQGFGEALIEHLAKEGADDMASVLASHVPSAPS